MVYKALFWAECATDGCGYKVCSWGSDKHCYPCEERVVGKDEMERRYNETHEHPWHSDVSPNYMVKTYDKLSNNYLSLRQKAVKVNKNGGKNELDKQKH